MLKSLLIGFIIIFGSIYLIMASWYFIQRESILTIIFLGCILSILLGFAHYRINNGKY